VIFSIFVSSASPGEETNKVGAEFFRFVSAAPPPPLQIKSIAIIAEGVPENKTRLLVAEAKARGVTIIGPATVGAFQELAFTRYCHYQYWIVHGIQTGGWRRVVYCAMSCNSTAVG